MVMAFDSKTSMFCFIERQAAEWKKSSEWLLFFKTSNFSFKSMKVVLIKWWSLVSLITPKLYMTLWAENHLLRVRRIHYFIQGFLQKSLEFWVWLEWWELNTFIISISSVITLRICIFVCCFHCNKLHYFFHI